MAIEERCYSISFFVTGFVDRVTCCNLIWKKMLSIKYFVVINQEEIYNNLIKGVLIGSSV